ncbi:MAG TPA: 3-oxoacyl-ACP reductase family protein [Nitrospirota bacterium]|nr:3-oxoacyl-ACP reductase family protein [Nitrospirota bacterium]
MPLLEHKRAVVVTGASRGLGREIALKFGRAGDRVVVNYVSRDQEAAAVVDEILRAGGEAVSCRADVRITEEVGTMIDETAKRWGALDVLVNNAGITKDRLMLRLPEQDWDRVLDTNLAGAFYCIRAASRIMSGQRKGHIINISSIVGARGREGQAPYAASKAGLLGLTKAAARELGVFNIKVNAVLPGYLPTEMGGSISDAIYERVLQENILNRVSDPREVAEFIYHLSRMNNVSGQIFNLDSRIL